MTDLAISLDNMTAAVWARLPEQSKRALRDLSDLTPQLVGLEGARVEVVDRYGETRRFNVGRSTGWRPCHLEIHNARSIGGPGVTGAPFQSVRVVRYAARGRS